MKYSILMPYIQRAGALHNTLLSFAHHYGGRDDYEVLILEDEKNISNLHEHAQLLRLVGEWSTRVPLLYAPTHFPDTYNPASMYNYGASLARGENLVLTSPEVLHLTNVLSGFDAELAVDPATYIVAACESAKDGQEKYPSWASFRYAHRMWYQHSVHRNVQYHFCSSIPKAWYEKLGGICEEFSPGIAYEDNDFLDRVRLSGIRIVARDDLHTVHLWHPKLAIRAAGYRSRVERNRQLYERRCQERRRAR